MSKRSQEQRSSQAKRPRLTQDNNVRPGKVSKIHLKNFMCHTSMKVDFNPNINFIIGRNGSGKSAVLTALIIVLGGKASDTNRSTSMKEFIKKGCPSATIDIEIANVGPFAYKPNEFGNVITVSRQIFINGRSQYKIKSETGAVISTKRAVVLQVTSALKIMIDNPLSVLTQDTARTFLNSSDPKKKYIFFTKATSLESIKSIIDDIVSIINTSDEKMTKYFEENEILKQEVSALKKQLQKYKSMDALQQSKKDIEIEMQWSHIIKLEQEKSSAETQLEQALSEIEEIANNLAQKDILRQNLEKKIKAMKDGLHDKQKETHDLMVSYKELRANDRAQQESYKQKANELKNIKSKIMRTSEQKNILVQEIEAQEKQLAMVDICKAEREQKINSLTEREKELKDLCSVTEMELSSYFGNNAKLQDDIERLNGKMRNTNGKISQTTALIRQLDSQSNNALSLFGAHVPQLVEMIKKAYQSGRFTELPRGPLGNHIEVKNKAWSGAIEQTLGYGFLQSFFVTNSKDRQTLINIIKTNFPNIRMPMIITSKFVNRLHNISQTKAQSDPRNGIISFLDAIRVKDPVVANCMIDHHGVEQILLFESEDVAMQMMSVRENVPDNCHRTILKDGTIYYPMPNYRVYCGSNRSSKLLQISIKERQMQLTQELNEFKTELSETQQSLEQRQQQCEVTKREMNNLKAKINEYNNKARQVQNKLQQLKDEEDPAQGNVDMLQEELEVIKRKENELNELISEHEGELAALKCEIESFTSTVSEAKNAVRESESACLMLQEKLDELEQTRSQYSQGPSLEKRMQQAKRQSEEMKTKIGSTEEKIKDLTRNIDDNTRPQNPRTMPVLKEELQQVKSNIRSLMALVIDPVALQEEFEQKSTKLKESQEKVDGFQKAVERLVKCAKMRHQIFIKLRQHMTCQVQHYFMFMLQMRQYKGNISIDHKNATLHIEVDPKSKSSSSTSGTQESTGFRDLRSLSGGERSYSTVSFLIALWNSMNLPFYFLDEFDVFMDQMNRKIIMDVLMQSAHENPHKQYVFLTPQDTSSVHASDTVKIHKLADPER